LHFAYDRLSRLSEHALGQFVFWARDLANAQEYIEIGTLSLAKKDLWHS